MPDSHPKGLYMAPVKLGPKGQIVIPKEVRDMFGIGPGDRLMLMADETRGIALCNYDDVRRALEATGVPQRFFAAEGAVSTSDAEVRAAAAENGAAGLPGIPGFPGAAGMSGMAGFPGVPGMPNVPGMPDGKGGFPAPGVFAPQDGGAPQDAQGRPNAPNEPDGSDERQTDAAPADNTEEAEA